jgi:hypothetical protein
VALPYPIPTEMPTKLRCQFSLPGRKYNCRHVGNYRLEGRRYCGAHYDSKWRALNPELGPQHDWHIRLNSHTGEPWPYETCRFCMSTKQHEGLPQGPCRGRTVLYASFGILRKGEQCLTTSKNEA